MDMVEVKDCAWRVEDENSCGHPRLYVDMMLPACPNASCPGQVAWRKTCRNCAHGPSEERCEYDPDEVDADQAAACQYCECWEPASEVAGAMATKAERKELWADLVDAKNGENTFGGDTAEIYAYRFKDKNHRFKKLFPADEAAEKLRVAVENAGKFYGLLFDFLVIHPDCTIRVDGRDFGEWVRDVPFEHRSRVQISKRRKIHGL